MAQLESKSKWTIRELNSNTYLIRETDEFGEYPHIYARPISISQVQSGNAFSSSSLSNNQIDVILLIDTGCGTKASVTSRRQSPIKPEGTQRKPSLSNLLWPPSNDPEPQVEDETPGSVPMTLYHFLSTYPIPSLDNKALNPDGKIPYLVAISHCHYDHIMGLEYFPTTPSPFPREPSSQTSQTVAGQAGNVVVLASSHDPSFITPPFPNLNKHSLCEAMGFELPNYKIEYWASHAAEIVWPPPESVKEPKKEEGDQCCSESKVVQPPTEENQTTTQYSPIHTGIFTLHTPGHTPDSLSIYDSVSRHLYIGDTIYERESSDTAAAGEPLMPIMFDRVSDLSDWFESVKFLLQFVQNANLERDSWEKTVVEVLDDRPIPGETLTEQLQFIKQQDYPASLSVEPTWLPVQKNTTNGDLVVVYPENTDWASIRPPISLMHLHPVDPSHGLLQPPPALNPLPSSPFLSPTVSRSSTPMSSCSSTLGGRPPQDPSWSWTHLSRVHHQQTLPRVKLGAAHVTADADAEDVLNSALQFVEMVIQNKVPSKVINNPYLPNQQMYYWCFQDDGKDVGRWSVASPLEVIERERKRRGGNDDDDANMSNEGKQ